MCHGPDVIFLSANTAEAMRQHVLERIERSIQNREENLKSYECMAQTKDYLGKSALMAQCATEKAALDVLRDQRIYLKRAMFAFTPPKRDCTEIYT